MTLVIMKYTLTFSDITSKKKKIPVVYFFISVFNNYTISVTLLQHDLLIFGFGFGRFVENYTFDLHKLDNSDFHSFTVIFGVDKAAVNTNLR